MDSKIKVPKIHYLWYVVDNGINRPIILLGQVVEEERDEVDGVLHGCGHVLWRRCTSGHSFHSHAAGGLKKFSL